MFLVEIITKIEKYHEAWWLIKPNTSECYYATPLIYSLKKNPYTGGSKQSINEWSVIIPEEFLF